MADMSIEEKARQYDLLVGTNLSVEEKASRFDSLIGEDMSEEEKKVFYNQIIEKDALYKQRAESLETENLELNKKLNLLTKSNKVFDSALESMVKRQDINGILEDIANIFRVTGDFVHSEINVFKRGVRNFAGLSYNSFMGKSIEDIIDKSKSKFSTEDLKILGEDIKQSSFLTVNVSDFVYVSDTADESVLRNVFGPVFQNMSDVEIKEAVKDKISKTTKFEIKAHLSALLSTYKIEGGKKVKIPLGYFHLTKKTPFSDEDFYVIKRAVTHSALAIDNYFNIQNKEEALKTIDMIRSDELSRTKHIMKGLIPSSLPSVEGWDFASLYEPMEGIGGDCYDVFRLDDDNLGYIVFDVVGHGSPAALFASSAKTFFVKHFGVDKKLSSVMRNVFLDLKSTHPSNIETYLTAFIGVLNVKNGDFSYCSGGHESPAIYRHETSSFEVLKEPRGKFLHLDFVPDDKAYWQDGLTNIGYDDHIVMFTDGFYECFDEDSKLFKRYIFDKPENKTFGSAQAMLEYFKKNRENYTEQSEDDVTCVATYRRKKDAA